MTKESKEKERKLAKLKIIRLLKKYNIDISGWGGGSTKTVEKLVDEALSGESQLLETKEDGLLRVVEVANGIINFTNSSGVVCAGDPVHVVGSDIFGLDRDEDGVVCEW